MKKDADTKTVKAAWETLKEIERLTAAIEARTAAPKLLWQQRHREHEQLVKELAAEQFDVNQPLAPEALAAHGMLVNKIAAYEKLFEQEQRAFTLQYGGDGAKLFDAICRLQKLLWEVAAPFELRADVLRRHGFCGLGSPELYSPAVGAARVLNWGRNFAHDCAQRLVSLSREILQRKMPDLPHAFGMVPRPLNYSELQFLEHNSTKLEAA